MEQAEKVRLISGLNLDHVSQPLYQSLMLGGVYAGSMF